MLSHIDLALSAILACAFVALVVLLVLVGEIVHVRRRR